MKHNLRKLVTEHYDHLFRAARFMTGDTQAAEDLAQETFLAAAESLDSFEGRSSAYTWLYGILLNKFRHWLRQKRKSVLSLQRLAETDDAEQGDVSELLAAPTPGPAENAERAETARMVWEAIDELPADHRSVITLRFVEDMSYQEIAQVMDCPIGTVKSRIHYALQKIADRLAPPQEKTPRPGTNL